MNEYLFIAMNKRNHQKLLERIN